MDKSDMSKVLSHALRHAPSEYGLELDEHGWAPVERVIHAIRQVKPEWDCISVNDLSDVIANSDKCRHEIRDGHIRALYGHSVPGKYCRTPLTPPIHLYHGTSPDTVESINRVGLLPMNRQYVHLSVDQDQAIRVGRRRHRTPVVYRIAARLALSDGTLFFRASERIWLAESVASRHLEIVDGHQ